ncbi:hypothetical protein BIW11_09181 [Tropilaelaps mercedesae]|uniref:Uncharacterized protein n=1 Tax=Tropilaelaps mercedesae TaxID=418985 RepID=A0A1V9XLL5_9ACAR|nr:hypothetical protein BIW11_09181 [Tropilaelaps mercedesae]
MRVFIVLAAFAFVSANLLKSAGLRRCISLAGGLLITDLTTNILNAVTSVLAPEEGSDVKESLNNSVTNLIDILKKNVAIITEAQINCTGRFIITRPICRAVAIGRTHFALAKDVTFWGMSVIKGTAQTVILAFRLSEAIVSSISVSMGTYAKTVAQCFI